MQSVDAFCSCQTLLGSLGITAHIAGVTFVLFHLFFVFSSFTMYSWKACTRGWLLSCEKAYYKRTQIGFLGQRVRGLAFTGQMSMHPAQMRSS
jgi:hypothetical protein